MKCLGKQPVRLIHSVNGEFRKEEIKSLVVYLLKNGTMYSNVYGRSTVILENGEYIIRKNMKCHYGWNEEGEYTCCTMP